MTKSLSASLFRHAPDGSVQVPLFATPREILQHDVTSNDAIGFPGNTPNEQFHNMLTQKYEDSSPTFRTSIVTHGVQSPVVFEAKAPQHAGDEPGINLVQGNHRFSVAAKERPDIYIPLSHHEWPTTNEEKDRAAVYAGFPTSHDEFVW